MGTSRRGAELEGERDGACLLLAGLSGQRFEPEPSFPCGRGTDEWRAELQRRADLRIAENRARLEAEAAAFGR